MNPGMRSKPAAMTSTSLARRLQGLGLIARVCVLGGALLMMTAILLPVAWLSRGEPGVLACLFAGAICLVPAVVSLGLTEILHGAQGALTALLLGMLLRMGVPLAACFVAFAMGGPLVEGGLAYYLLALYPVMLVVERAMCIGHSTTAARREAS
jgi:hypothetical protein